MKHLLQALSAGYVKLIDWKSIENANMATVEFKTQLLEAAVAAGTVEKTADGMYREPRSKPFDHPCLSSLSAWNFGHLIEHR